MPFFQLVEVARGAGDAAAFDRDGIVDGVGHKT